VIEVTAAHTNRLINILEQYNVFNIQPNVSCVGISIMNNDGCRNVQMDRSRELRDQINGLNEGTDQYIR